MGTYTPQKEEAAKELEEQKISKIKEHLKYLLEKKARLEGELKDIEIDIVKAEEEGVKKEVGVSGGNIGIYSSIGSDTNSGSTGIYIGH